MNKRGRPQQKKRKEDRSLLSRCVPLLLGLAISLMVWASARTAHSPDDSKPSKSNRPVGILFSGNVRHNKINDAEIKGDIDAVKFEGGASDNEIGKLKVTTPVVEKPVERWYAKASGILALGVLSTLISELILRLLQKI